MAPRFAPQRGFTYLGLLVAVALLSVGLVGASEVWVASANRERALQLDWAGQEIRRAIGSYYESSPGGVKAYPLSLEDLLEDRRHVVPRRHLRRLYRNPFSEAVDWDLMRVPGGGIQGIRAPRHPSMPAKSVPAEFRYTPLVP